MSSLQQPHPHDIVFHGISRLQDPVFFVQIGAADGKRADPVYPFARRYRWEGVLVEPLEDLFCLLQQNYSQQKGIVFENVAITEQEETRTISRIPLSTVGKNDVPRWAFGASSLVPEKTVFSSEHSHKELHDILARHAVDEQVRCMSLPELLDKHNVTRLDVLQIDTEGYDAKILKQLDFSRHKPGVINMEWQWLTEDEKVFVSEILNGQGYHLNICGEDLLATTKPLDSYKTPIVDPVPDQVPVYFPGVIGLINNIDIDIDQGGCAPFPAQIDIFRAPRGKTHGLKGDAVLSALLTAINGGKTYREISEETKCNLESILGTAITLKELYIIE